MSVTTPNAPERLPLGVPFAPKKQTKEERTLSAMDTLDVHVHRAPNAPRKPPRLNLSRLNMERITIFKPLTYTPECPGAPVKQPCERNTKNLKNIRKLVL